MLSDLPDFDRRAVALALYRMLTGTRYNISSVRAALRACGQLADKMPGFATLRLHHCADFADLPDGFAHELASRTLGLFHNAARPPHLGGVEGDGFMKELAAAAGLDPKDAPTDLDAFHRQDATERPDTAAHVSGDGQAGRTPVLA